MDSVQQTGKGLEWLFHLMFGLHPLPEEFTTLNQRLNVFPNLHATTNERSTLNLLVVGNRGHGCSPGVNGISRTTRNLHSATNTAPFSLLPLAARPVDDDLTEAERARYCLRTRKAYNGVQHNLYHGLWMNITRNDLAISKELVTKVTGQPEDRQPWVPDNDDLFPQPIDIPNQGAVTASNTTLQVRALLRTVLTEAIISEFLNAIKLEYDGDESYGILSEFALCSSVPRVLEVPGAAGMINFREALDATVYSFANDHKTVYMNTQSLELDFDVGNGIPLIAVESIPTLETIPGP